jgi:hypothetical protein
MKSKKLILRSIEIVLGLSKIEDVVDFDIRGIIRDGVDEMESQMGDTLKMIKTYSYEMKMAFMKFYENATNLAEAEYGPYFTPKNFHDSMIKMMSGNPLNMMALINKDNVIKN